jgi:hypothetical protein
MADEPIHEISGMPAVGIPSGVNPTGATYTVEYIVILNSFDSETKAYFAYSLEEAMARKAALETETGASWRVAIVLR